MRRTPVNQKCGLPYHRLAIYYIYGKKYFVGNGRSLGKLLRFLADLLMFVAEKERKMRSCINVQSTMVVY